MHKVSNNMTLIMDSEEFGDLDIWIKQFLLLSVSYEVNFV